MKKLCEDNRFYGRKTYYMGEGSALVLVPDIVKKCVVFVGYTKSDGSVHLLGTALLGFIGGGPVTSHYLVTAKHVIDEVWRSSADGRAVVVANGLREPIIKIVTECDDWVSAKGNPPLDISVYPIDCDAEGIDSVLVEIIDPKLDTKIQKDMRVGVGDEVFITGLFTKRPGKNRNIPIIRVGTIATMSDPSELVPSALGEIEGYLIDAISIGGLSGSPVFVMLGDLRKTTSPPTSDTQPQFYLLGIMHGHFVLPESNQAIDSAISETDSSKGRINSGIGIVIPTHKIWDVLNDPSLTQRRLERENLWRINSGAVLDAAIRNAQNATNG